MTLTLTDGPEDGTPLRALLAATERHGAALVTALLGLAVALLFVEPLVSLPLLIPRNYNEGWNAYHALRALAGTPLYPEPAAVITNNYPPLSFYLVGGLGLLVGDAIIAGRMVAMISLLVVALNVGLIAWRLGASGVMAAFGGLLVVGYAPSTPTTWA